MGVRKALLRRTVGDRPSLPALDPLPPVRRSARTSALIVRVATAAGERGWATSIAAPWSPVERVGTAAASSIAAAAPLEVLRGCAWRWQASGRRSAITCRNSADLVDYDHQRVALATRRCHVEQRLERRNVAPSREPSPQAARAARPDAWRCRLRSSQLTPNRSAQAPINVGFRCRRISHRRWPVSAAALSIIDDCAHVGLSARSFGQSALRRRCGGGLGVLCQVPLKHPTATCILPETRTLRHRGSPKPHGRVRRSGHGSGPAARQAASERVPDFHPGCRPSVRHAAPAHLWVDLWVIWR